MSTSDILIFSLFFFPLCTIALSWLAGADAPYVPTKMELIKKILKSAGVNKNKKFYELGSGDGRVIYEAAQMGADSIGIEQSWLRVWYSIYQAVKFHLPNAHFFHGDIFKKNYKDADIIYIYLLPKGIKKLEQKLPIEVKRGTIIITQTYHFTNLKPFKKSGNFSFYRL